MKKLSIILWLGLIIDLIAIGGLFYYLQLQQATPNGLDYQEQEAFKELYPIAKVIAIAIAIQAVSVLLLFVHKKLALFLAMLSGFITLPVGCVYIIGFLMSYNNLRFAELPLFNSVNKKQLSPYLHFRQERFYIVAVILGVAAVVQFSIFSITASMGVLLVVAAIVSAVNGIRLTNRPVLGIYGDQLVITPSLFSKTYQVSCEQVAMKKKGEKTISFIIQTHSLKETVNIKRDLIRTTDDHADIEEIEKKLTQQGAIE
ncbi:hypothetical protein B5C26_22980 [Photorhabdus luminescens]|uniref:Uncharacterized protein n=1 Tax=Photorhabdus luminescens subsp. mexicana TaxID=2100167 RepID=A0A4R4IPS4_PHOLU|nr:hypothetical protein [Photorhabdus luminescens]OWO78850.1 hypothetical protein B5C26_22980 [Photorhabdus luminescens]TDB42594.1 hypothetical protein C5468_24790 [Photorhabdus luminescens subsp. mexicana]